MKDAPELAAPKDPNGKIKKARKAKPDLQVQPDRPPLPDRKAKAEVKDRQLIIRVKGAERDAFVDLCEALDTSAAREIRRFMREFTLLHTGDAVAKQGAAPEMTLKEEPKPDGKSKHQRAEKRS